VKPGVGVDFRTRLFEAASRSLSSGMEASPECPGDGLRDGRTQRNNLLQFAMQHAARPRTF
jgi:hypothetical protein